jgi:cobalt-zinc-cadmium efflux system membrane fusion protein
VNFPRTALLLLLILAGHLGWSSPALAESIEISPREMTNLGITLVRPARTDQLRTIDAMASVVVPPQSDLAIAALQSGMVARLYAGSGDRVSPGAPLAGIISREFLNQQSDYLDALGMQALAEATRERDERLHEEGIVSQRRLNESRTQAAEAELHLAEQRQMLLLMGLTATEIQKLEETRELLELFTIRAPISGEILQRWVGTGDRVNAGDPLFRVADLTQLWLELQIPAEVVPLLAPGFIVTRKSPDSGLELARLTVATHRVDPDSQKVVVRAETTNSDHQLLPGQRLEVTIHVPVTTAGRNAIWEVPARSITRDGDQPYLFARNAGGFDVVPVVVHGGKGESAFIEAAIGDQTQIALNGIAALKAIWLSAED